MKFNKKYTLLLSSCAVIVIVAITGLIMISPQGNRLVEFDKIGQIETNGEAFALQIMGDFAYVIDTTNDNPGGLVIIDVSDPSNPIKCSSFYEVGLPHSLWIFPEKIVYLGNPDIGIEIINVTDPYNPVKITTWFDSGLATNIQVVEDLAFIADGLDGLEILNVSDPTQPTRICRYRSNGLNCHNLVIKDDIAYVTDHFTDYTGLVILNVSDPVNPVILGSPYYRDGDDLFFLNVKGNYLYAANHGPGTGELQIFDVSDPFNITLVGVFSDGGVTERTYFVGDLAFVTNYYDGLEIVNVSDPSNPSKIGQYREGSGHSYDVVVRDDIIYLAGLDDGLEIIQFSFKNGE